MHPDDATLLRRRLSRELALTALALFRYDARKSNRELLRLLETQFEELLAILPSEPFVDLGESKGTSPPIPMLRGATTAPPAVASPPSRSLTPAKIIGAFVVCGFAVRGLWL